MPSHVNTVSSVAQAAENAGSSTLTVPAQLSESVVNSQSIIQVYSDTVDAILQWHEHRYRL